MNNKRMLGALVVGTPDPLSGAAVARAPRGALRQPARNDDGDG